LFWTSSSPEAIYSDTLDLDLSTVEASLAGPSRPQDRVRLGDVKRTFEEKLPGLKPKAPSPQISQKSSLPSPARGEGQGEGEKAEGLKDGDVVIAAITSCTNTSNPSVLMAAGLLAKKAVEKGLSVPAWVKTSLAPGSQVVTDYLTKAGLLPYLEKLKFHVVGYGCTTCIGNSGPLDESIAQEIRSKGLVAAAVLSGNRNFEGRINADVRANYLASPPLVVAYALAGRVGVDLSSEPLGIGSDGKKVFLKDIWPSTTEISEAVQKTVTAAMFRKRYADVFLGDKNWRGIKVPEGDLYAWDHHSTYVQQAPYFDDMPATPSATPRAVKEISGARVLAFLGDSVTTDHISPAGSIKASSPAGKYLQEHGVTPENFNSYGSRRGNHEVMVRGTFANVRLKNKLVDVEGGMTKHLPDGKEMSIFDASVQYQKDGTPLMILAGKEYGSGSSRDWAAKGPKLLGIRAVIAESYERIHRSNLVGMGILPLEFEPGDSAEKLGLTGKEIFSFSGLTEGIQTGFKTSRKISVTAKKPEGQEIQFSTRVRIDTPQEVEYYRHGGILQYVLRKLLKT
ncbi:MAG: aconitate hydratase AcnA, partial [Deltaproteobacteria bacterium]|nr:aconitate hydratase AcnA [Deltaproteobacteria bacterium]